jgi:hypothetical protein
VTSVTIDPTGVLVIGGQKVFPLGLSLPPPVGGKTPDGKDAWKEIKGGGASFVRTGRADWNAGQIDTQIATEKTLEDAAAANGLHCWMWLGALPNLPTTPGSAKEQLLTTVVDAFKDHPGLGAYKGIDEPQHSSVPAAGLIRAQTKLRALDPDHPVVIIQAPVGTVADLTPYQRAFDITGADIYPVAYPPGEQTGGPNKDLSVVGDVTTTMVAAAGGKPVWMTLQIAWSGTATSTTRPAVVPRFPSLPEERFMAYQAIVNGARGLVFFGGHFTQITRPRDAKAGWNWTFWQLVLKPLLLELTSTAVGPALVAPDASATVTASAQDVELVARQDAQFLWVIAVRRGAATSRVTFSGLPSTLTTGQVLFEYTQDPLPPPIGAGQQVFRSVAVSNGTFRDWFGPHDAHVYRFGV